MEKILPRYFAEDGPGAVLGAVRDGREPWVECCGRADLESGKELTPETTFELASASKIFTASAIMLLVERGEIALETPIHEPFPELKSSQSPNGGVVRPITIQDLLAHTSGLADYLAHGMYTPPDQRTRKFVLEQLPEWAAQASPGLEFAYSNTNYVALARLTEIVSGKSFSEFVVTELTRPFGLSGTFVGPSRDLDRRPAIGYRNLGYGLACFEEVETMELDTEGDGGIYSSLNDLLRWQSLFWNHEILRPETVRRMRTPGTLDSGERFPYGLGLQVESNGDGMQWCGHGGSWTTSTTLIGRYLEAGLTVVVLSNEFMAPVERLSQRVAAQRIAAQRVAVRRVAESRGA